MKCQKCANDARWVNNGPRLQYWYCGDCKVEVVPPPPQLFNPDTERHIVTYDMASDMFVTECFYCSVRKGQPHKDTCKRDPNYGKTPLGMGVVAGPPMVDTAALDLWANVFNPGGNKP